MQELWEELDALCAELAPRGDGESGAREGVQTQREALAPALALLDQHERDLRVEELLALVQDRLLGGVAVVQRTRFEFGLERLYVLGWSAGADPRPERAAGAGEYRVEVWLGIGEAGRPRVRVVGARRLEAALPVARDKLRAVLLGAVRDPAFVARPSAEGSPDAAHTQAGDATQGGEAATASAPVTSQADQRSGEEGTAAPEAPSVAPPPSAADRPPPPPDDTPIPMGPMSGSQGQGRPEGDPAPADSPPA